MNERTPVSAYRLLSRPCDKSIVFVSSCKHPVVLLVITLPKSFHHMAYFNIFCHFNHLNNLYEYNHFSNMRHISYNNFCNFPNNRNWHEHAAFQRSAFGRSTAGNDVVATIFIIFSFSPPPRIKTLI